MRMLTVTLFAGCFLVAAAEARVVDRARTPRSGVAVEPSAPVADRPTALIRASLEAHPVEPIPIGEFGPFGQSAGDDVAPVAPLAEPVCPLLDLKLDADPGDAAAPVTPAP